MTVHLWGGPFRGAVRLGGLHVHPDASRDSRRPDIPAGVHRITDAEAWGREPIPRSDEYVIGTGSVGVVCIHGLGGWPDDWIPLARTLAASAECTVLMISNEPNGRTPEALGAVRWSHWLQRPTTAVEELWAGVYGKVDGVIAVGHSAGGLSALWLAQHGHAVNGVLTIGTPHHLPRIAALGGLVARVFPYYQWDNVDLTDPRAVELLNQYQYLPFAALRQVGAFCLAVERDMHKMPANVIVAAAHGLNDRIVRYGQHGDLMRALATHEHVTSLTYDAGHAVHVDSSMVEMSRDTIVLVRAVAHAMRNPDMSAAPTVQMAARQPHAQGGVE